MGNQKLNVGCGRDVRVGWINLDCVNLPGVDIVHNLQNLPLPFDDEVFDKILCRNILEHMDYIPLIGELHRVLKPGGVVAISVPHFTSKDAFADPTHRRLFTSQTFRYFIKDHSRSYYFDFSYSSINNCHIHFDKRLSYIYNYILEYFINFNARTRNYYEGSLLRIFPATNITIEIIK